MNVFTCIIFQEIMYCEQSIQSQSEQYIPIKLSVIIIDRIAYTEENYRYYILYSSFSQIDEV